MRSDFILSPVMPCHANAMERMRPTASSTPEYPSASPLGGPVHRGAQGRTKVRGTVLFFKGPGYGGLIRVRGTVLFFKGPGYGGLIRVRGTVFLRVRGTVLFKGPGYGEALQLGFHVGLASRFHLVDELLLLVLPGAATA